MKTNDKTENTADTTVEQSTTVESQVSEQQEQLLDSTLVEDTGNNEQPQQTETFETVSEQWNTNSIGDEDILQYVSEGVITPEQVSQITGDTIDEIKARVQAGLEQQPATSEPMPFVDAYLKLMTASKAGTSNAALLADVAAWRQRNEISEDTMNRLVEKLAETSNGAINTTSSTSVEMTILNDISANFAPMQESLDELKKEGSEIINSVIKTAVEFEGSMASRLVQVLAGIAVHGLNVGKQTGGKQGFLVTRRGEADITKQKPYTATTHQSLWGYVKREGMFGDAVTEQTEHGGGKLLKIYGKTFDPYSDPSVAAIQPIACKKALLVAYGHVTKVRFGYWSRKSAQREGKTYRPSRLTMFHESIPEGQDAKHFYRNLCIPANVLTPLVFNKWEEKVIGVVDNGETKRDIMAIVLDKEAGEPNQDETLRWLSDDVAEYLYQHHFAGHELSYNLTERGNKLIPIGCINGSYDPRFPPNARKRETQAEKDARLNKALADLTKVSTERDAALKGIEKEDRVSTLQALEAYAANKHMSLAPNEEYHAFVLATVMLERLTGNGKRPSPEDLKALLAFKRAVDAVIDDNPERSPIYKSPRGDLQIPIAA